MFCVGTDGWSQFGDGGTSSTTPVRVAGTWSAVAVGMSHTCALDLAGEVHCTGDNINAQLGTNSLRPRDLLVSNGLIGVSSLVSGQDHTCAIQGTTVWCWGANNRGQLRTGTLDDVLMPRSTYTGASIVAANQHTCVRDETSRHLHCWGDNINGQLGDTNPTTAPGTSSFEVPTLPWRAVTAGRTHTCAVSPAYASPADAVYCWGSATWTGTGMSSGNLLDPAQGYNNLSGVATIHAGGSHTFAILPDGSAFAWGGGYAGQLGTGNLSFQATPVSIMGKWQTFAGGVEHSCGVREDGTLWCWGYNRRGALGIEPPVDAIVQTQVGADADWTAVSTFETHTCGIKAATELWCWGENEEGALGTGGWRTELVQVP
jgi:alpha-tubulin suppressor-like RCC1 family protein